jgi:hypothetical protein
MYACLLCDDVYHFDREKGGKQYLWQWQEQDTQYEWSFSFQGGFFCWNMYWKIETKGVPFNVLINIEQISAQCAAHFLYYK